MRSCFICVTWCLFCVYFFVCLMDNLPQYLTISTLYNAPPHTCSFTKHTRPCLERITSLCYTVKLSKLKTVYTQLDRNQIVIRHVFSLNTILLNEQARQISVYDCAYDKLTAINGLRALFCLTLQFNLKALFHLILV